MTSVSTHSNGVSAANSKSLGSQTQAMPRSATEHHFLVNAAFLQEIKDSNPNLWHFVHELRASCDGAVESSDTKPQTQIREFARTLDELRDLVSLQFALEESYGYLKIQVSASGFGLPEQVQDAQWQAMIQQAIAQHSRLYLMLSDLVEQAEELQYRGCDRACVSQFVNKVAEFTRDLSRHERLEAELVSYPN